MGDRATVELKFKGYPSIYFYSHWSGSVTHTKIAAGLLRGKPRWGDESYLARIMFEDWVGEKNLRDDVTGFGLAPYPLENEHADMIVHMDDQRVEIRDHADMSFDEFIELAATYGNYDEFVYATSRQ